MASSDKAGAGGSPERRRSSSGRRTSGNRPVEGGVLPPRRSRRSRRRRAAATVTLASRLGGFRRTAQTAFLALFPFTRARKRRRRKSGRSSVFALLRPRASQLTALVGVTIVLLSVYLMRHGILVTSPPPYTPEAPPVSQTTADDTSSAPTGDQATTPSSPEAPSNPEAPTPTSSPAVTDAAVLQSEEEDDASVTLPVGPSSVAQVLAGLASPAGGQVARPFGFYYSTTFEDWRYHSGVDIALATGDQIRAAAAGTVSEVDGTQLEGWRVVISHGFGVTTTYSQMSAATPRQGDSVSAGESIGLAGAPGFLEADLGPHLHYEIRVDGDPTDPAPYLGP
jgi:hypothetical protein